VIPLAAVRAQESAAVAPADVDATIRAAIAQKNHEMAERAAAAFEILRQYETAVKLLESAVAIRQEVSGDQSAEYGVGLIKLGDLERKRGRINDATSFYTKAVRILGDLQESSPAFLQLGILTLRKDPEQAAGYFDRAA